MLLRRCDATRDVALMMMLGLDATHYRAYVATYAVMLLPLIAFDLRASGHFTARPPGAALLLARHALHQAIANTDQWQRIAAWLTPPL